MELAELSGSYEPMMMMKQDKFRNASGDQKRESL